VSEILFKDEAFQIMGAAFEVYNHLGNGFLEAVYQEALELEFKLRQIPAEPQKQLHICYKGHALSQTYRPAFVVYNQIIVELKTMQKLGGNEMAQVCNYLKLTNLRLGLLLNFGAAGKLEWKRIVV